MRFLARWIFRLLILIIVLAVAAVLLMDTCAKALMEARIRSQSGMDVRIGRVEIGLVSPTFRMEGFKLYNPAEFGGSVLMEIPELYMEYDRDAASRQELHFKLVRLNISQINVVRNAQGRTNLEGLQAVQAQQAGGNAAAGVDFKGIDQLSLTLGKMGLIDLRDPKQNRELVFGVKDEVVPRVRSLADFMPLMVKIAMRQGPSLLGNGWLNGLLPMPGTTNPPALRKP